MLVDHVCVSNEPTPLIQHVSSRNLKCSKKNCDRIPCDYKGQEKCINECNCYSGYTFCNKKGFTEFRATPSIIFNNI